MLRTVFPCLYTSKFEQINTMHNSNTFTVWVTVSFSYTKRFAIKLLKYPSFIVSYFLKCSTGLPLIYFSPKNRTYNISPKQGIICNTMLQHAGLAAIYTAGSEEVLRVKIYGMEMWV